MAVEVIDGKLTCSRCGITKPTSEFSKGKNKSGFRSHCKQCVHEAYLADKERILQKHKDYYERNKESKAILIIANSIEMLIRKNEKSILRNITLKTQSI